MKLDFKIKQKNEDFIVKEIYHEPDYCDIKEAIFSYLWIEKSGITTFDLLEILRKEYGLKYNDLVAQGLKDEDGVTNQLISIRKSLSSKDCIKFNRKNTYSNFKVKINRIVGYGKKPLETRKLHGNKFILKIRNLKKIDIDLLTKYFHKNKFISFINYYDNQRFGMVGGPYNTHLIGKAIISNNYINAYKEYKKTANNDLDKNLDIKDLTSINCKNYFKKINKLKINFFISAYNSFIFNKKVSNYIKKENKANLNYFFEHLGYLYLPKINNFVLPNIINYNGYKINNNYEIEKIKIPRVSFLTTNIFVKNINKDELNSNKYFIELSFFLPTGSYATMLIKQLFYKLKK